MNNSGVRHWIKRAAVGGGIAAYIIMAFEVAIMISPFAFFFYSVFNPIFHFLDQSASSRWLTAFFLPHMIVPPSAFLRVVRVAGSVLFVTGAAAFAVCALQVYAGKIFKWRIATRGLYQVIRHPQYVALILWGVGMSILWPRFLVLVTLAMMVSLYYFLAGDEERRMTAAYGDDYRGYTRRTGMFLPLFIERLVPSTLVGRRLRAYAPVLVPVVALSLALMTGFGLRALTVTGLSVRTQGNLGVVSILPEDNRLLSGVAAQLVGLEQPGKELPIKESETYLAYLMPPDYVMQGMIANTGEQWQLYKRGHTVQMISDWVFHPFRHLQSCPMHAAAATSANNPTMSGGCPFHSSPQAARRMMCPLGINDATLDCGKCPYRRVILVKVDTARKGNVSRQQLLAAGAARTPVAYVDLDVRSGKIVHAAAVRDKTAWQNVPTPIF